LRHTFIGHLARAGVHPKTAQALARHSSITLMLDTYTAPAALETQSEALAALPDPASGPGAPGRADTGQVPHKRAKTVLP